jgi:hypothetical protein
MKFGTNNVNQGQLLVNRHRGSCFFVSHAPVFLRCSAKIFSHCRPPSVVAGLPATAAWPYSIIAGAQTMPARVPSAALWLRSTTEGGYAVVAWAHSAAARPRSAIAWDPSVIARRRAMIIRSQSAFIYNGI